jgi:hypothetical protein
LIGQIIAVVGIAAVFAVIAYAGYKVVKKWSGSQPTDRFMPSAFFCQAQ